MVSKIDLSYIAALVLRAGLPLLGVAHFHGFLIIFEQFCSQITHFHQLNELDRQHFI